MYALQKRAGPLGMYNPSAMKISKPADALAAFDKHKTDRGLPSALTPAQLKRAAQKEVDDGDDAYSSLADQRACGSSSRAGGSGAGGGGGKGKERESLAPQNEAERKAMRREEQERDRESVWAREWEAKRNREKVEPRVLGVVPDELNSSDDDDLPDVGALGRQRHVVKGKNKVAVAVTVDASERKFQEHQGKADKRGKVEELSFELSFSSTPSSSALPNIKKKTEEEMAGPRIEFSFTASRHRPQPKASTSKLVHSLDSDDDDSSTAFPPPQTTKNVKRPIDLGRSSPSPRRLSSSARRASQSPDGSSDEVESAVSPRRAPLSRPRPKAKVNNRPLRDTANPFAHPDNKKPSSPSKSSSLDASRFPDPKPSELKSASSFGQLPDSSREETPESEPRDVIHDVAGMKLVSKARRKVALSPKSKSRKEQAERDLRDREAKGAGEDNIEDRFEDLLDTGSEEEVVNLKGKQPVQAQGERKSVVRSSSVDKVTLAMAEEMKESEEKQKKLALYGEEDVVYETDTRHPNPELLCIFCSELLPPAPSPKLLHLIASLKKSSHSAPTTFNPHAVFISMTKSINACTLHRSESKLLPIAEKNGWPTEINWVEVQRRVRDPTMVKQLADVVRAKDKNKFLLFAKGRAEAVGLAMARTAKGQYEVFENAQPGYFGEIGQILFHQMLSSIFIPSRRSSVSHYGTSLPLLSTSTAFPLTPSDFVYFVLIPELAIQLIMEDLAIEYAEAFAVMQQSRAYGNSRFAAEEGEAVGGVLMQGWDEEGVEMDDGEEDGIFVSRRRRNRDMGGKEWKGKERGTEPVASAKVMRPPSSSPSSSDLEKLRRKRKLALAPTLSSVSLGTKANNSPKRPRSVTLNPPPAALNRAQKPTPSLTPATVSSPDKKKPEKTTPSAPTVSSQQKTVDWFFKPKAKPAPPPPPVSSLLPLSSSPVISTSKKLHPKPETKLCPTSSSASVGQSSKKQKILDLDSDEEERDKTATPPQKEKKRKSSIEDEVDEGESQPSMYSSPRGRNGKAKENGNSGEAKRGLGKKSRSFSRTESENQLWEEVDRPPVPRLEEPVMSTDFDFYSLLASSPEL